MNANILSFNELHDDGWTMSVPPHGDSIAFCGWHRSTTDAHGVNHKIPVTRNGNSWESQLIVADTPVLAATVADAATIIRNGASISDFAHLITTPGLAHLLRDSTRIGIYTHDNHARDGAGSRARPPSSPDLSTRFGQLHALTDHTHRDSSGPCGSVPRPHLLLHC